MRRLTPALVAAGLLGAGGCAAGQAPAVDSAESAAGRVRHRPDGGGFGHLGGNPRGRRRDPRRPGASGRADRRTPASMTASWSHSPSPRPARAGTWCGSTAAGPRRARRARARPRRAAGAVTVGTDPDHLVAATPRPGTDGAWARVRLPAGASTVYVGHGPEHRLPFPVDTGERLRRSGADRAGADGPECAAASAGPVLAGDGSRLDHCPADALSAADAADLRAMVTTLADRRVAGRRAAGRRLGRAVEPRASVVLRDGHGPWPAGRRREPDPRRRARRGGRLVRRLPRAGEAPRRSSGAAIAYEHGVWLAPWLLTPGVVDAVSGTVLPLRFDVRGTEAQSLQPRPCAGPCRPSAPTEAGFAGWRARSPRRVRRAGQPVRRGPHRLHGGGTGARAARDHGRAGSPAAR